MKRSRPFSVSVSEFDQPKSTSGKGGYPPEPAIRSAGREMKFNPPAILSKTRAKKGKKAANKQRVAIMLNKARKGF